MAAQNALVIGETHEDDTCVSPSSVRLPPYQVHDRVLRDRHVQAVMTGSYTMDEDWQQSTRLPQRCPGPAWISSGAASSSVGSLIVERSTTPRVTVEEVEVGEVCGIGGHNKPFGTRRRRRSRGISWRRTGLEGPADEQELDGVSAADRCVDAEARKRRFSRRATSTVTTIGRNVAQKVAGWLKRDSGVSDVEADGVKIDGVAANEESSAVAGRPDAEENVVRSRPSLADHRDSLLLHREARAQIASRPHPRATRPLPDEPPQTALADVYQPKLSDSETVAFSQLSEQMAASVSQAKHNGRLEPDRIAREFQSMDGNNRSTESDQVEAMSLLRKESQLERQESQKEFEASERKRLETERRSRQWSGARRDGARSGDYVQLP
ncbi:hypothetical protein LTR27_008968 [Elasticomyces elasticus]|nr:hypothetical protein LTR27_008968 [Elasticomyces elasticus]